MILPGPQSELAKVPWENYLPRLSLIYSPLSRILAPLVLIVTVIVSLMPLYW